MQGGHANAAMPAFFSSAACGIGARSTSKVVLVWPTCGCRLFTVSASTTMAVTCCTAHGLGPPMNDLRLQPFDFNQALARAGLRLDGQAQVQPTDKGGFQAAMADALKSVSAAQTQAQGMQRELALGNPNVSIEQTMTAMVKAQIGFQATLQVRNRLAQAYSEVMNMQV